MTRRRRALRIPLSAGPGDESGVGADEAWEESGDLAPADEGSAVHLDADYPSKDRDRKDRDRSDASSAGAAATVAAEAPVEDSIRAVERADRHPLTTERPSVIVLPEFVGTPLLFEMTEPGRPGTELVRVDEASCLVGRGAGCDLSLSHPDISRRHALLQRVGHRLLFIDLCSRTGVVRDGRRHPVGWLAPGKSLMLGPYSLRWNGETDSERAVPAVPPEHLLARQPISLPRTPSLGLRIADERGGRQVEMPLERPITLAGRASLCKLRLRDESVARVHAGIMVSGDGVFVNDLVRRDGITVNGRKAVRCRLDVGDEVRIGHYRLILVDDVSRGSDGPGLVEPTSAAFEPISTLQVAPTGVPEPVVLALVDALADLQRQFYEQSRQHMDLMGRLVESVRSDLRDELLGEVRQLRAVTDEIRIAQRESLALAQSPGRIEARPSAGTVPLATEAAVTKPAAVRVARPQGADDAGRIAQRIAQLQRERAGRWERLLKLVGASG